MMEYTTNRSMTGTAVGALFGAEGVMGHYADGMVVAAWGGVKTDSGEAVYAIWGSEGNWAEPVRLSPNDGNDYREPDVEIDATGLVHVIWSTPTGGIYHVIGSRSGSLPASP